MNFVRIGTVIAMLSFLGMTTVGATQQSAKTPDMTSSMHRASQMIGADVENLAGEDLGKIEDIVIDPQENRVAYAVLSFGGFLGLGEKYFAIPWSAFQHKADEEDTLILNVNQERLENAQGFDKNNWPDMANRQWGEEIHAYYNLEPYWLAREGMQSETPQPRTAQDVGQQPRNDAVSATVETIDQKSRQLILTTANGGTVEFKAPAALLQDLQQGDSVEVTIRKTAAQPSPQVGTDKQRTHQ